MDTVHNATLLPKSICSLIVSFCKLEHTKDKYFKTCIIDAVNICIDGHYVYYITFDDNYVIVTKYNFITEHFKIYKFFVSIPRIHYRLFIRCSTLYCMYLDAHHTFNMNNYKVTKLPPNDHSSPSSRIKNTWIYCRHYSMIYFLKRKTKCYWHHDHYFKIYSNTHTLVDKCKNLKLEFNNNFNLGYIKFEDTKLIRHSIYKSSSIVDLFVSDLYIYILCEFHIDVSMFKNKKDIVLLIFDFQGVFLRTYTLLRCNEHEMIYNNKLTNTCNVYDFRCYTVKVNTDYIFLLQCINNQTKVIIHLKK